MRFPPRSLSVDGIFILPVFTLKYKGAERNETEEKLTCGYFWNGCLFFAAIYYKGGISLHPEMGLSQNDESIVER